MAISKDKKNTLVADLTALLSDTKMVVYARYQGLSVAELQKAAENQATDGGLLERAEENARKLILTTVERFFAADEYTVEFE